MGREAYRLTVTSLLHDVGKLVLLHAYPGYPSQVHRGARTPEERIHQERRELGVDHALVGGVLVRRWGLPSTIATPIERHHNADVEGEAAFVRLADMLAHYEQGTRVNPAEMLQSALIHDAGKGRIAGARFGLRHRVAYVGLERTPRLLDRLARYNRGLASLHGHSRKTIALAREYGASPGVVDLLEAMDSPLANGKPRDERARLLMAVDDQS